MRLLWFELWPERLALESLDSSLERFRFAWLELDCPERDCPELFERPVLDWPVLDWPALDCPELDWPALDWPALDWPVLDWLEPACPLPLDERLEACEESRLLLALLPVPCVVSLLCDVSREVWSREVWSREVWSRDVWLLDELELDGAGTASCAGAGAAVTAQHSAPKLAPASSRRQSLNKFHRIETSFVRTLEWLN